MVQILKSLHGNALGLAAGPASNPTNPGPLVCPGGFISGAHGSQISLPSPTRVVFFDDFLGDVVADQWAFTEGTDSSTSDGAILSGVVNGVYRLTAGDSAGTAAADQAQLNSYLQWKANTGGLAMEARVKLAAITTVTCFIGLTDTLALETPIESAASADTLTTTATDAVGVMFDTRMSTDKWWLVGVANDVDATAQNSGVAPVAATYETWRIEVSLTGAATFYRNGVQIGATMTGAVTPTVLLTPVFCIRPEGAVANRILDVDYVSVACDRV